MSIKQRNLPFWTIEVPDGYSDVEFLFFLGFFCYSTNCSAILMYFISN